MSIRKFWNGPIRPSVYIIVIVILGALLLFAAFYAAGNLSSIPLRSLIPKANNEQDYVRDNFIQVMVTTDKAGIVGVIALVNSILVNSAKPVHFYFVTSRDSASELLTWMEEIQFARMSYVIKVFDPNSFGIDATGVDSEQSVLEYSKFYIMKLFPQVSEVVICLSNDVIVQGDIADLHNISISRNHFAALSNDCDILSKVAKKYKNKYFHYLNMNDSHLKELHINGSSCTLDLSVMVLNMTLWMEEDVTKQLEQWMFLNKTENIFLQKDALLPFLIVFYNRTSLLNPIWHTRHLGVRRGTHHSRMYLDRSKLLQWDGHFKPWLHKSAISNLWSRYAIRRRKSTAKYL